MKGTGTIFLLPTVFMYPFNNFSNSWDPVYNFGVLIPTEKSPHHSISNILLDFHSKVDGIGVILAVSYPVCQSSEKCTLLNSPVSNSY